jgi:hypothetical protein
VDAGEHERLADSPVARDTQKAPNPAFLVDSDRPEALGVGRPPKYHRCNSPARHVLGVGVMEVGCEKSVAIHDNHGGPWVIKRKACFLQSTAGPKQGCFARKPQRYIAWTRRF